MSNLAAIRTATEPRDPATVDTAHVEGGEEL